MPLQQIVEDTERTVLRGGIKLRRATQRVEDQLFRKLQDFLRTMSTSGGNFVPDATSRRQMANIRRELNGLLDAATVNDAMKSILPEFDRIDQNVAALHGEQNNIRVPRSLVTPEKDLMVREVQNSLFNAGYDARFADPVQKVLYNHINFAASLAETENALHTLVYGMEGQSGLLSRWASQVARDGLSQFQGRVHQAVQKEYKLEWLRYVGGLVKDSRWQCRKWVRMEYLRKDQLRAEIRSAFRSGSGMIPGTSPNTFCIHRGGYNCLHTAFPTRDPNTL